MTVFNSFFCFLSTCSVLIWLLVWFAFMPCITASQTTTPFPEIKFSVFSNFISSTFNSNISLATVLMMFFTLIENPELLNLHAQQKNLQLSSEKSIVSSAWMCALCHRLKDHLLDHAFVKLFKKIEFTSNSWKDDLSRKLDGSAECLDLTPYQNGSFHKKLLPISQKYIQPEYILCPHDMECTKYSCYGHHLSMSTQKSDILTVTLIKGNSIFKGVSVLTGQCRDCHTLYSAHLQSYKDYPQDKLTMIKQKFFPTLLDISKLEGTCRQIRTSQMQLLRACIAFMPLQTLFVITGTTHLALLILPID